MGETIGAELPPDTPLDASAMKHALPNQKIQPDTLSGGLIATIVMMSSLCCCIAGWKTYQILHRRRRRGKLHAIGRMTHSHETQTFASLDALSNNNESDTNNSNGGNERYLTANSDNFVGISMQAVTAYPLTSEDKYNAGMRRERRDSGAGRGSGSSKDAFEVTAFTEDRSQSKGGPKKLHLNMSPRMEPEPFQRS